MRIAVIAVCMLLLTSCSPEWTDAEFQLDQNREHDERTALTLTRALVYTKDERVNICYAWSRPYYQSAATATVPCEQVEHLLAK